MRYSLLCISFLVRTLPALAVVCPGGNAWAGSTLDQTYTPGDTGTLAAIINDRVSHAQMFTVGTSGILSRVELTVSRNDGVAVELVEDLVFELQETSLGLPSGTVLASVTIPKASVPLNEGLFTNPGFFPIDLSAFNVAVSSGDVLALILRSPGSLDTPAGPYFWLGDTGNPYGGGQQAFQEFDGPWEGDLNRDLGFATFLDVQCAGDCGNGDGAVDVVDLLALLAQWGATGTSCDLDGGGVDIVDLLALLADWGACVSGDLVPLDPNPQTFGLCDRDAQGDLLVKVGNIGLGACGSSTVRVDYGSHGVAEVLVPPLGPGASVTLDVVIAPGCFNPDCEFTITVDVHDDVVEVDESNNSVDDECIG